MDDLFAALASGDADAVKSQLSSGDVDLTTVDDNDGLAPMHWVGKVTDATACENITEALKSAGADINGLNRDDELAVAPIHVAACAGNNVAVSVLAAHGADLNLSAGSGYAPCFLAWDEGHIETALHLLSLGADANARDDVGRTILERAVVANDAALVERVVKLGANPDAPSSYNKRVMQVAIESDLENMVSLLARLGADVNGRTTHDTPYVVAAAQQGSLELTRRLVDAGARVGAESAEVTRATHNNARALEILTAAGALV